ncbi:prepilin peptidase [Pseudaminobacter sp. 19-2017]|uniref:Prepilin peptidase n=1 Tax=Pseudaminobacter soli (ex Zhang et al. 2022) TaxID=2831468 RepID=A0A942I774_9HYPH|nr:prepilin peptidase [Pseudaminobacter soli]MBS3648095.1 prepilin peptidase [Pseudaminobacter soli]
MISPVEPLILAAAATLMAYTAWEDFSRWKIPNGHVMALIALYAILALSRWLLAPAGPAASGGVLSEIGPGWSAQGLWWDLGAGALLFVIGFALWALRMMGAGDAKLLFPIGLFVGWADLLAFAFLLMIGGVLAFVLLKLPIPLQYHAFPGVVRLEEIRKSGKVPYGVVMVVAALIVMAHRYM